MEVKKIIRGENLSVRLDDSEYRIDRLHKVFYRLIRNVIIFFIGFGAPLDPWLKSNDIYRQLLDKHRRLWLYYRLYCWLLTHICLVLNISSLIYLLVWLNKDVSELCQQLVQLVWSLSAVVAIDSSYHYRRSTLLEGTCHKTDQILEDCPKIAQNSHQYLLYDIKIPLHLNFIKHFYKIYSIPKLTSFVKLFMFSIIFNLYLYIELVVNYKTITIEKILNLFMFMNIFIVTVNILIYLAFCLVFSNKFRHLNQFIKSLKETKNTTVDQLFIISKWYSHNCSKVTKFDQTFNMFIVTFYISIAFNIIVSIFGIILHTNVKIDPSLDNHNSILLYNIFYYTFIVCNTLLFIILAIITFMTASNISGKADKTRKLIEDYVTSTTFDKRCIEFNIEYQHLYTTCLSKPVTLTLFGFGSITKVSLGMALIACLPYIPDIVEFSLEHKIPINQKDLNRYINRFVNETLDGGNNDDDND